MRKHLPGPLRHILGGACGGADSASDVHSCMLPLRQDARDESAVLTQHDAFLGGTLEVSQQC